MRIYLNTSALNRPLDDLSSDRVRLEAEAVVGLLAAVERGVLDWVGSAYLDFEVTQDSDRERVRSVRSLLRLVGNRVRAPGVVAARARALEGAGFRGLDALHIASAEVGGADLLITTDDRLIPARRQGRGRSTGEACHLAGSRGAAIGGREPMKTVRWTNAEIRARGWDALLEKLGPSGALRFAMQTERGHRDYATRRHRMLGRLSVDELLALMRQRPGSRGVISGRGVSTPRRPRA